MRTKLALLAVILVVALVASTSCVGNKKFRSSVDDTDARVSAVESGLEANEKRIDDLSSSTDSKVSRALSTADQALKTGQSAQASANQATQTANNAASGKVVWKTTISNDGVKFTLNGVTLSDTAKGQLDGLARKVTSSSKGVYVEIEGHTDSSGDPAYNQKLGLKRAAAVREYLAQKGGIPLHLMNVISYGETKPVADNSTRDGRAQNRRVVVRVLE